METGNNVFLRARNAWMAGASHRQTRKMLKQFTYGRQWEALLSAPGCGASLSVYEELCLRNKRRPLTNNLIRALIKSVVGRFRLNLAEEERPAKGSPAARVRERNLLDELDSRALEEFLISGCAIQRVVMERRFEGLDVWVDNVNPTRFFCNRFLDPRGSDLRMVGMLHEMSLPELCTRFGHGSRRRQRELAAVFESGTRLASCLPEADLAVSDDDTAFLTPADRSLCRVVEVWTFEIDPKGHPVWMCRFFGPEGQLLDQTPSPYPHRSHPFAVSFYPLTDGEVHPFIEDVIDQQRHINLLIATIDRILSHSAKGVLLLPQDSVPRETSLADVADAWSRPGGVIVIDRKASRLPQEISSTGGTDGASQLLDLEMKLFQQISGVTEALQGQAPQGHTSASLYDSQVQNSAIALLDVFETFNTFRSRRDSKVEALLSINTH